MLVVVFAACLLGLSHFHDVALSRFVASDSTKCSSLALAMIALLGRLLGALALSWSLALFTCGSLDFLKSWISTSTC